MMEMLLIWLGCALFRANFKRNRLGHSSSVSAEEIDSYCNILVSGNYIYHIRAEYVSSFTKKLIKYISPGIIVY